MSYDYNLTIGKPDQYNWKTLWANAQDEQFRAVHDHVRSVDGCTVTA